MKYSLIDTHCDTASEALDKNIGFYNNGLHVDLAKMGEYEYVQFFAAFIAPEYKNEAMQRAFAIIKKVKDEIEKSGGKIALCRSYEELARNKGKVCAFLSLEGGEPINSKDDLQRLYDEGIRMAALTWNYKNRLAAGVNEEDENAGLTGFGKEIVKEMNRLGIILDVSHLNERSFWDVIEASKKPVIASHSNAYSICPNKRNLTDRQFLELKKNRGIAGINLYPVFLSGKEKAGIDDIIKHIEHFLSLGGENNICMGADFDGVDFLPEEIDGAWDIYKLFNAMLKKGYSEKLVRKISYTNMQCFLQENL